MCVHFVPKRNNRSSLSLEIQHPRPTSAWFTRTKLPPTFWHWTLIRGLEFCEYFIAFRWPVFIFLQWNASSGERIRSFLSGERLAVVFYLYTVIFVFKHYKQLLLRKTALTGPVVKMTFFFFCTDFMFLFFWNLTAVSIFGRRLNDTLILSDANPDKHTTYETFSELLRWVTGLRVWMGLPAKCSAVVGFDYVMMNLWWLKIPISCFLFLYICNSLPCASCFSSEMVWCWFKGVIP